MVQHSVNTRRVPSKRSVSRSRPRAKARPRQAGRPPNGRTPTPRLSMSLEPALLARVRAIAAARDRSIAYVLRALLWKGIRALEAEGDGGELTAPRT